MDHKMIRAKRNRIVSNSNEIQANIEGKECLQ